MPRLALTFTPQGFRAVPARTFVTGGRNLASSSSKDKGPQNSTPSWEGRHGDDHVLHRDDLDAQSKPSHQARSEKAQGESGSGAISEKDEKNANQKAKEDHPEAPGPVIGMNSERGSKGQT
ncbi:hypothetical protein LTS08_004106 [Lithohypha guttulata]|uniref:uncharacterized protein n=1 Tax=Lithohypha guttulata TaxID=1690604 RepID=UPI002DDF131B|nr:hypothetical protein LTR51_005665 [Lithohypha guttulata]KAK5101648.1 hypothetical protein LTS08_004106 [Lithohypha guttulata]